MRGPGLHRGPVDERLQLLHAPPLAPHLPLRLQRQQHSRRRYERTRSHCKIAALIASLCRACRIGKRTSQLSPTSASLLFLFWFFSVEPFCLFRHLQQTGCSSASPSPTRSRMVRRDLVRSLHAAYETQLLTPACSHRLTPSEKNRNIFRF